MSGQESFNAGEAKNDSAVTTNKAHESADEEAGNDRSRALVDQLISQTRLYSTQNTLKELLEFTARLRHMAPFNALLLHVQKPGLSYAMTQHDWWTRFGREPKTNARPLVILRSFGPVDFVYDIQDTEGKPVPEAVYSFPAEGKLPSSFMLKAESMLNQKALMLLWLDHGDLSAGYTRKLTSHGQQKYPETFEIGLNRNHAPEVQFVTLAHELAHIYLGHCGKDAQRKIVSRDPSHELCEVEAETCAYLVAKRSGIAPFSESYLSQYESVLDQLDLHLIFTRANRIEKLLNLPL